MLESCKMSLRRIRDLWANRKGISALEYAMLAAGILTAVVTGANAVGGKLGPMFTQIVGWLQKG